MTQTLPDANIRAYYQALGIELPSWARTEASIRCFANPDAHRRGDHNPSCSINLDHGAWHCHSCGATGGAFDAATTRGCSPRQAIDLMVAYGLTQHRAYRRGEGPKSVPGKPIRRRPRQSARPILRVTEDDIAAWQANLAADPALIARLAKDRGWRYPVMRKLGLGFDDQRVTIPTRDLSGELIGLLRYQPWPRPREPKLIALWGSRRTMLPHPAAELSQSILLVEGEPDMIAARSRGLPAIAVPGIDSWRPEWASLFDGRSVTVVADADAQGRALASRITKDLADWADVLVTDLAPDRSDGYDLTDWLHEHSTATGIVTGEVGATMNTPQKGEDR